VYPENRCRCECGSTYFSEWTCEVSLKLRSRSRCWREPRPLS